MTSSITDYERMMAAERERSHAFYAELRRMYTAFGTHHHSYGVEPVCNIIHGGFD